MKQPKPLPSAPPFLTIYTSTHLRPAALVRNLASVGRQTAVEDLEQIVVPDHVGYGLAGGLFGRIPWYAPACRGRYVAILSDDDELADERAVERLRAFVAQRGDPPVVLVRVRKGDATFPKGTPDAGPAEGAVDLGSYVLRRDVWLAHAGDYGRRYQGDFDHAVALDQAGYSPIYCDLLFAVGPLSNGRPELSL